MEAPTSSFINKNIYLIKRFLVLCILTSLSFNTHAIPSIKWAKYQLPPVFIDKGIFKNKGMGDQVYHFLQSHLKHYSHSEYQSVGIRIMRDFKLKALVCSAMTSKKGRKELMIFSKPVSVLPSHNLHYSNNNPKLKPILNSARVDGIISLEKLLSKSSTLTIGLNIHRSFGDSINDILSLYSQQVDNLDETTTTAELMQMLQTQKIDLTIELPFISYYVNRSQKIAADISIEPMAESPTFLKAYIACSNNSAGKAAIAAINLIIEQHRSTKAYQDMFTNWIPPLALPSYKEGYQRIVVREK